MRTTKRAKRAKRVAPSVHQWSRRIPSQDTGLWAARLAWAAIHPPVITEKAGGLTAVASICSDDRSSLEPLVELFGGGIRELKPRDWLGSQDRDFVLRAGRHLVVASEGSSVPEDRPVLRIPAGMAFGTGEHATTAMCLRQLVENLAGLPAYRRKIPNAGPRKPGAQNRKPLHVIDAGTGSGILALAAAHLGAKVEAFDFDPTCIKECRANVARNPAVPKVRWTRADVLQYRPASRADVLVANLFAGLLVRALPRMKTWLSPGGTVILSGILREQEREVVRVLKRLNLPPVRTLRKGKWVCLVAMGRGGYSG